MPRRIKIAFDVHPLIAECRPSLRLCLLQQGWQFLFRSHDTHALATAPRCCFDQDGKARCQAEGPGFLLCLHRPIRSRHRRNAGLLHQHTCGSLVPHGPDRSRRWTDPEKSGLTDTVSEFCIFGEEPIPGMHRIGAGRACTCDESIHAQITLTCRSGSEPECLVCHQYMGRGAVRVRIDSDRTNAQLAACADDPDSDLAAVSHKESAYGPSWGHVIGL